MEVQGFELVNADKFERALNGTPNDKGELRGGVGGGAYLSGGVWLKNGKPISDEEVEALEARLIAEYDRLGGFIRRNGDKVKTGSFWDFKGKKAFEVPQVVFIYNVNGKFVEVADGQELPGVVRAARILKEESELAAQEQVAEVVAEKKVKKGKK